MSDALAAGVARASEAIEEARDTRGLDALRELALHPILHDALRAGGHAVHPEERFPRDRRERRRNRGARCDLVVTPTGTTLAVDPPELPGLAGDVVPCEDAAWIEVKVIAQFRESGPNSAYAHALRSPPSKDVMKLAADPAIRHGAILVLLFTAGSEIAEHDLGVWSSLACMHGLPLAPRHVRHVRIGDRLGNTTCTLALFPLERPLG